MLASDFDCNFGCSTVSGIGFGSSSTTSLQLPQEALPLIASDAELSSFAQACVWTSTLLALPLLPSKCNKSDEL
ncbi:uncharacterized protein DS421_11g324050 [Arachis hypogaea]|nr:uncharacterized protein DS421_11g324050 [Arachis hypogaea]